MRIPTFRWGLLPLLLLLTFAARAQSPDQEEAAADRELLDYRLEPLLLDARLTTGFLLEYGLGLTDLTGYAHPEEVPDSAISSPQLFRRAYATFATASVNDKANWLPPLRALNRRIAAESPIEYVEGHDERAVPLVLLLAQGQRLDPRAFDAGLIEINTDSQVVAASDPEEVYETITLFTAATGIEVVRQNDVHFVFNPDSLFVRTPDLEVASLTVDFGNGEGPRPLDIRDYAYELVRYEESGEKVIRYELTLADGTIYHATSRLVVNIPVEETRPSAATGYGQNGNRREYRFPRNDPNFAFSEGFDPPDATYGTERSCRRFGLVAFPIVLSSAMAQP